MNRLLFASWLVITGPAIITLAMLWKRDPESAPVNIIEKDLHSRDPFRLVIYNGGPDGLAARIPAANGQRDHILIERTHALIVPSNQCLAGHEAPPLELVAFPLASGAWRIWSCTQAGVQHVDDLQPFTRLGLSFSCADSACPGVLIFDPNLYEV
jgi:hypothetical protein